MMSMRDRLFVQVLLMVAMGFAAWLHCIPFIVYCSILLLIVTVGEVVSQSIEEDLKGNGPVRIETVRTKREVKPDGRTHVTIERTIQEDTSVS